MGDKVISVYPSSSVRRVRGSDGIFLRPALNDAVQGIVERFPPEVIAEVCREEAEAVIEQAKRKTPGRTGGLGRRRGGG